MLRSFENDVMAGKTDAIAKEYYESSRLAKYPFEPYWPEKKLKVIIFLLYMHMTRSQFGFTVTRCCAAPLAGGQAS